MTKLQNLFATAARLARSALREHSEILAGEALDRPRGYTHYNFGMGPDVARVIEAYLTQPTSKATQFAP